MCGCVYVCDGNAAKHIDSIMVSLKGIVAKNENERKNGMK